MNRNRNRFSDEAWQDGGSATAVYAGLVVLFATCVAAGGSARPDVLGVIAIRLVAIVALALALLLTPLPIIGARVGFARYAVAIVFLVAVQLIPLPPSIWRQLPGHLAYARMAEPVVGSVWRPLSMTPDMTINALLALLAPLAAAACAALQPRRRRASMLLGLAVVAGASGMLGLVQLAAGSGTPLRYYPITSDSAAVGIFANRNHHAAFLACAMPAVAAWARMRLSAARNARPSGFSAPLVAGACFVLAALAVATGSRFGIVAALIGAAGALAVYSTSSIGTSLRALSVRERLLAALVAVLVIGGGLVVATLPGSAVRRLVAEGAGDDARLAWLTPIWRMIVAFMPFGSGYGSFDSVYRGFEPLELLRPTYLNAAHDDLAQIAIEGGVGALLLLLVFLLWWGRMAIALWVQPARSNAAIVARAASVVILILLLASLVDYPLRTPLLACVFAVSSVWMMQRGEKDRYLPGPNEALTGSGSR